MQNAISMNQKLSSADFFGQTVPPIRSGVYRPSHESVPVGKKLP
jgi:hypothetical protein